MVKPLPPEKNIFSPEQEDALGDVAAESLALSIPLVEDDSLQARLREIGERLARYLPASGLRLRFFLVELPQANAFNIPGGRVYVSRKLVALARSDDELAGVLAHELGHAVTHQGAADMTRLFRDVLHVNQVGDHADIADKFHRFYETWRTKSDRGSADHEEEEQYIADSVALYATMRAGYVPQAYVDILDRLQHTGGKTGSWLSGLWEDPTPQQIRLKKLLKSMTSLPQGCVETVPASSQVDFKEWRDQVIAYDVNARHESLQGVIFKQSLASPLRPEINNLRFSLDGKFVLAQDSGGIHVLSRDPFQEMFFIDAPDAYAASFSPDSRSIAFYTTRFRVEVWDVATQTRRSVHEMALHEACIKSALSYDGSLLACITPDYTLSIFNIATETPLVTKKEFLGRRDEWYLDLITVVLYVNLRFSPDGRYFLAGGRNIFAYDLTQNHELSVPSSIRDLARVSFTFVGSDRIVGVNVDSPEKSPVLRFPSGERVQEFALSRSVRVGPATHGDYFLLGPLKENPLGIMEMSTSRILSFKRDTADIYDGMVLHEMNDGQLALTDLTSQKTVATLELKQSRLGGIRAVTVSDDLQWLALSTTNRGAVWDLAHNARVNYIRGFTGAWFGPDRSLYADFPKNGQQERAIGRLHPQNGGSIAYAIGETLGYQEGPFFVGRKQEGGEKDKVRPWMVEVHDLTGDHTIWTRRFRREVPAMSWNPSAGTLLMSGRVFSDGIQEELKQFPDVKRADNDDYFLELRDVRKDAVLAKMVIKTNKYSFAINDAVADGNWVAAEVSGGRVVTYSLDSGDEKGHVFGVNPILSAASGLFAVSAASGEVNVYQLADTQVRRQLKFSVPIAYKRFSPDGKRLFVLTRDQTAYVVDLSNAVETTSH